MTTKVEIKPYGIVVTVMFKLPWLPVLPGPPTNHWVFWRREDRFSGSTNETTNETFKSKYLVMATGPFGKPKPVNFRGMETFPGRIMHSYGYKTGKDFKGQKVLVVGFGNSACEIAIDLYE